MGVWRWEAGLRVAWPHPRQEHDALGEHSEGHWGGEGVSGSKKIHTCDRERREAGGELRKTPREVGTSFPSLHPGSSITAY